MLTALRTRRSAITLDLGAAGLRACQLQRRGNRFQCRDSLQFDRPPREDDAPPPPPLVDAPRIERFIGSGNFEGREVALVLSPPEVQFIPIQLPPQALNQEPDRVEQALKWEVAQQSRRSGEELEVRYWLLPPSRGQAANVMAVALPAERAAELCTGFESAGLLLRRIDVTPCALVRLALCLWTPGPSDLWGVLDIGLRHSVLTVVLGTVPTYIRLLPTSSGAWTKRLAQAFEVSYTTAEQLKREHGLAAAGAARASDVNHPLKAGDLPSAILAVLRDSLDSLANEIGRCFSYMLQGAPEATIARLYLAGGGAHLGGLAEVLSKPLGIPVLPLHADGPEAPPEAQGWPAPGIEPRSAAVLGGALLDLEAQ